VRKAFSGWFADAPGFREPGPARRWAWDENRDGGGEIRGVGSGAEVCPGWRGRRRTGRFRALLLSARLRDGWRSHSEVCVIPSERQDNPFSPAASWAHQPCWKQCPSSGAMGTLPQPPLLLTVAKPSSGWIYRQDFPLYSPSFSHFFAFYPMLDTKSLQCLGCSTAAGTQAAASCPPTASTPGTQMPLTPCKRGFPPSADPKLHFPAESAGLGCGSR